MQINTRHLRSTDGRSPEDRVFYARLAAEKSKREAAAAARLAAYEAEHGRLPEPKRGRRG